MRKVHFRICIYSVCSNLTSTVLSFLHFQRSYGHSASVLRHWIRQEYGEDKAPSHYRVDAVPQQENTVDCGVFTGRGMAGLVLNDDQMVSQAFCNAHRLTMLLTIVRESPVLVPGNVTSAQSSLRIVISLYYP